MEDEINAAAGCLTKFHIAKVTIKLAEVLPAMKPEKTPQFIEVSPRTSGVTVQTNYALTEAEQNLDQM
jgi:hypothetical protein